MRRYAFDRRRANPFVRAASWNIDVAAHAANDAMVAQRDDAAQNERADEADALPIARAKSLPFGARRSCFEPFEAFRTSREATVDGAPR